MTGFTDSKTQPAFIESGVITHVDASARRVKVRTEVSHCDDLTCLVAEGYHHVSGVEGLGCVPEVGAHVWVCRSSNPNALPFVIGFRRLPSVKSGSHAGSSENFTPGSLYMLSRDGNGVRVHRGGVTEVGATPICRRFYLPIGNKLHDIAQSYRLDTLGGTLEWLTAREEEDPDGSAGTKFRQTFKEYADDKSHVVEVQYGGQVEAEGDPVFLLKVFKNGDVAEDDLEEAVALSITKEGAVHLKAESDVVLEIPSGKTVSIYTNAGQEKGVVLSEPFLSDLSTFLAGLQGLLTPVVGTVPGISDLLGKIATSAYTSTHLKAE